MSYMLKHTAEELDLKLDLIDENKNLLEYPYTYLDGIASNLEDVGDGSFLLKANTAPSPGQFRIQTALTLPAGTYTASVSVENALMPTATVDSSIGTFAINLFDANNNNSQFFPSSGGVYTFTNATTVNVRLTCWLFNGTFPTDVLIKPQIEAGEVKTTWVPNMDRIGTYVDRRFNSLNAKIKVLTDLINGMAGGSGLPDCTGMPEGAMLVVKNGAWAIDTSLVDDEILVVEPDEPEIPDEQLYYELDQHGNYTVMGLSMDYLYSDVVVIPATYKGKPVTSIGDSAFKGCHTLTSVTIPDSVTTICDEAFHNCSGLTSITIPSSVTSIDSYVFDYCDSLTVINCEFAEGAVKGAPWGAENATINYSVYRLSGPGRFKETLTPPDRILIINLPTEFPLPSEFRELYKVEINPEAGVYGNQLAITYHYTDDDRVLVYSNGVWIGGIISEINFSGVDPNGIVVDKLTYDWFQANFEWV